MAEPLGRTRTPPDIKWLLNERAALAGAVAKVRARQEVLRARRERAEHLLQVVLAAIERSDVDLTRSQASLNALDATMKLAYDRLEPSAGGAIQAWAGKYGKRGALGEFVALVLRDSQPAAITMPVLMNLAIRHFGLSIATTVDRRNFNKSVSSSLRCLHKRGLIEPLYERKEGVQGVWRWKGPTGTLDGLRARAGLVVSAETAEPAQVAEPAEVAKPTALVALSGRDSCPKNDEVRRTWR